MSHLQKKSQPTVKQDLVTRWCNVWHAQHKVDHTANSWSHGSLYGTLPYFTGAVRTCTVHVRVNVYTCTVHAHAHVPLIPGGIPGGPRMPGGGIPGGGPPRPIIGGIPGGGIPGGGRLKGACPGAEETRE